MRDRPLLGNSDWAPHALVVDVPRDAVGITFGLAVMGAGQVWLDGVTLETAGADVPTTGQLVHAVLDGSVHDATSARLAAAVRAQQRQYRQASLSPVNLDFERGRRTAAR